REGARPSEQHTTFGGGGRSTAKLCVGGAVNYHDNRHIIKNVLAAFSVDQTINWFTSLAVDLKREVTGKLFPVTDKARTVLNALVTRCLDLGVSILPDHRVTDMESSAQPGFLLQHNHGTLHVERVILATGGRSIPKSGSDGFGYNLARRLGHSVTATVPALVPLSLKDSMFHKTLSGLSQEVELTTMVQGRKVDQRTG